MQNKAIPAKSIMYPERIVIFIDILGFSDAVRKSADDGDEYKRIDEFLAELQRIKAEWTQDYYGVKISSFSDNLFISCSVVSEQSLNDVCRLICEFYLTAIHYGFFFRGALTVGGCQEKDGIMFGPACLRAYELQEHYALWPRCIVDPDSLARSNIYPNNSWRKYNHYVLTGNDGVPYLDYLGYSFTNYLVRSYQESQKDVSEALKNLIQAPKIVLGTLREHKESICQAVQEASKNSKKYTLLLTKYYPLATYHNQVIRRIWSNEKNPDYFKRLSEYYGYITGKKITESNIRKIIPSLTAYRDKYQTKWQQQLIDIETLFNGFYASNSG